MAGLVMAPLSGRRLGRSSVEAWRSPEPVEQASSTSVQVVAWRGDRSGPPKPFVLAVDDEEHITELLAMGLGFNGFEVERAASGRAALAAVERRRPDLIILDVMLPDLDGFEVARRLRQNERAGTLVPVIFLTARDATADKVEGLRSAWTTTSPSRSPSRS